MLATVQENKRTDFHGILANVAHETRNNLKHFGDVAVNSLNPGLSFLFSRFVIVGNSMEQRADGFS